MKKEIRIAILAIVSTFMVIWGYNFVKGKNILSQSYTFYLKMDNTHGIAPSTPVMINGLELGTVTKVYLDSDMYSVIAELEISKKYQFPKNMVAEIFNTGIMGGKGINLAFDAVCQSNCAETGDTLQYKAKGMLSALIGEEDEIGTYMGALKDNIGGVLDSLDAGLRRNSDKEGLSKMIIDLQKTVSNLKTTTESLNSLLANSSGSMSGMLRNFESISATIKSNNSEIEGLLKNVNTITEQVKNADAGKTVEKLNTTLTSAEDAIDKLQKSLLETGGLLTNLNGITTKIDNGEGSIGQLLNSEDLYINLEKTTKNLELLLQDLRLNPRRYLNISVIGRKDSGYELPEDDPAYQQE